ncbi:uncharacterized protein LOC107013345 [Solanum pennellii]|uniref:Uncharacterized protein LOC107013345 n=1 Tax=Solanum pennellii TaxID=28526 RepID=A0ABM1GBN9_SOLPN|nr:uncharacterized protein LOC107013345 [Solanum pennellii]
MASRLRNFSRMNPPMFYRSKADEDPQDFLDEVYMILFTMGVTTSEKEEFVIYELKDVAQTWYTQLRDNRVLRGCPVTWEFFKGAFLDRLFPREFRESKVEEFINLCQGCISVLDYSYKFTKLSKYASSLVSNPRDEMSHFPTGVSDDLVEERHSATLHDNMNIYRVMVHSQQVEESRIRRNDRDSKRERSFVGGSSKWRLKVQDKHRFKKSFSNQNPSKYPKAHDDRVYNPKSQK